jgi:mannose-6-phosphate isomerase-like protein (cupin superfamily)
VDKSGAGGRVDFVSEVNVVRAAEALDWAAVGFGSTGDWELRVLRGALGCDQLAVSTLRLAAGTKITTGHRHPAGEEVYVLVSGRAEMKIDDEIVALEAVSAVRVRHDQIRALRALAGADVFLVVASHPQDDPSLTEFFPDFWPVEGTDERGVHLQLTLPDST